LQLKNFNPLIMSFFKLPLTRKAAKKKLDNTIKDANKGKKVKNQVLNENYGKFFVKPSKLFTV